MKAPPPMPEDCGSTRLSTSWVAIAASIAEPPARSISRPASAAYALAADTMCRSARASTREYDCDGPSWASARSHHAGIAASASTCAITAAKARFVKTRVTRHLLTETIIQVRYRCGAARYFISAVSPAVERDRHNRRDAPRTVLSAERAKSMGRTRAMCDPRLQRSIRMKRAPMLRLAQAASLAAAVLLLGSGLAMWSASNADTRVA